MALPKIKTSYLELGKLNFYQVKLEAKESNKAVLLFPEAFSLTGHLRDVAHRLAREGYAVYLLQIYPCQSPDFFIGYSDKELREKMLRTLNTKSFINNLALTQEYFSNYESVFSLGFSIGGYFSLVSALVLKIKGLIAYYPNPTVNNHHYDLDNLNKFLNPPCPSLFFFGAKDRSIPLSEVEIISKSLPASSQVVIYPESSHGFFCNSRHVYNKNDAKDSWLKCLDFLKA